MSALQEIANKAISDYGFRQIVQWTPDDIVAQWELSDKEADVLKGPFLEAIATLPVPVEPKDYPAEQGRFAKIIGDALGKS
jgi:hypothetical protein